MPMLRIVEDRYTINDVSISKADLMEIRDTIPELPEGLRSCRYDGERHVRSDGANQSAGPVPWPEADALLADPDLAADIEALLNPPALEPTLTESIAAALPEYRWQVENGGTVVGGVSIQTDQPTRANLIGARIRAVEDAGYTVNWKTPAGFVAMDAATIIIVADAVAAHIQKCFDAEAAITGQTFESIDAMKAAFDAAYDG